MSEWVPDDEDVEVYFALGAAEYKVGGGGLALSDAHDAYRRWIAAHDKALREQIARAVEDRREHFIAETRLALGGLPAWIDVYLNGLDAAIDVARWRSIPMTERDEYTPSMDEIKSWYAGAVDEYRCDTGMSADDGEAAFDRAIAANDRALREQIADDLRIEALNEDPDIPDTYREGIRDGLMRGVDIARGEEQTDE